MSAMLAQIIDATATLSPLVWMVIAVLILAAIGIVASGNMHRQHRAHP